MRTRCRTRPGSVSGAWSGYLPDYLPGCLQNAWFRKSPYLGQQFDDLALDGGGQAHVVERLGGLVAVLVGPLEELLDGRTLLRLVLFGIHQDVGRARDGPGQVARLV